MSDQTETPPPAPKETKPMSPMVRSLIIAGLVLILFIIVIFGGNQRTKQTRTAELERSVDALSEAIEPNVLGDMPQKLENLLVDIAKAGKYKEVTVSDNSGKIIASTNAARKGGKSEAMKIATDQAKAQFKEGEIVIRRAIILAGDTRYGNLEIRVAE